MDNNNLILDKSKKIIIALIVVGGLVATLSVYSMFSIAKSVERNTVANELIYLLDNARLEELIYTRDGLEEDSKQAQETIQKLINLATTFDETNPDVLFKTENLVKELSSYQNGFNESVALHIEKINSKQIMVAAARKASTSSEALQNLQEKYINNDKTSIRKYRNEMSSIIENSSMSQKLVVIAELAKNLELNYFIEHNKKDLNQLFIELNRIEEIKNSLKRRVKNERSKEILLELTNSYQAYKKLLAELGVKSKYSDKIYSQLNKEYNLLRKAALALQQNEKDLLFSIQESMSSLQDLLEKRLSIADEATTLMKTISDARQADRDFSLAHSYESKSIFKQEVYKLLESAVYRANKISNTLIEDDEKVVFKNVQVDIETYFKNFKNVVSVYEKSNLVTEKMVASALKTNRILSDIRVMRLSDLEDSKNISFILSIIGIFMFIVIGILIILIYKLQAKLVNSLELAKSEIEHIHKHTQESIEYASLIQGALIPDNQTIEKYFPDFFTIWEPKDVIGGDIYLFEELRGGDESLMMVIDCTGHGVPGAFVTMLVKAIERQVISKIENDKNIDVSPAWILSYFNRTMKKLLQQESDESISNAGFDGGIVYYNKKENIIKFAGAETALFYIEDKELKTIKGNRHSIGYKKSDASYDFKEHIIHIKEDMKFYLTTDGYLDQNGGKKSFPMGRKQFTKLIVENQNEIFMNQRELFLDALANYQGEEERNDDVTVVGFEIKEQDNVKTILEYNGVLTQGIIAHSMDVLENSIEDMNATGKISTIVIELTQNMMHYSKSKELNSKETVPAGLIEVTQDSESKYYVKSENIISIQDKIRMETKLTEIKSLDAVELKKRYRELRKSGAQSHEKGGGIGFYEIAKLTQEFEYNFKEINAEKFIYEFKAIVSTKKKLKEKNEEEVV